MKTLFVILFLSVYAFTARAQDYGCVKLKSEETTRKGYFETIVFKEKKAFSIIQGIAVFGGDEEKPLADVFIEVFTNNPKEESKRVAGCRTNTSGRFYFPNLPKGNYKIRFSKEGGFKITDVLIKLSPKSKGSDKIIGVIQVGV